MKKNLLQIITLALCLVNLVMTVLIVLTLVPSTTKVNNLITQIADAIELDLSDDAAGTISGSESTSIDNIDVYLIEDSMTINLKPGEDGSNSHVAVLTIGIDQNMEDEDYATYGGSDNMSSHETMIKSTLNTVISSFSYEEIMEDKQAVKDACTEALQELFDSTFIIGVEFSSEVYQ